MFKKLIQWLQKGSAQSEIEAFIASKCPKSAAEVDFWLRQYDTNRNYHWGRGL